MVTQQEIMQHKDAGKHAGDVAEHFAKKNGFGKYASKIGAFVKKFVEKKQKTAASAKATEPNSAAPPPAAEPATAAA
jgi:hypothetical protein